MIDASNESGGRALGQLPWIELGERLFKLRDYTPIPLVILLLFTAEPTVATAAVGTLVAVFGELIRLYSVAFIGSVSRTRNTSTTGGALISNGPFGVVRNPLYVGNFFMTTGLAIFGGIAWVVVVTVAAFAFQYHAIVKHEEQLLRGKFGAEYESYLKLVPAWVPARIPALDQWEWPDSFSPALKSEKRSLTAMLVLIAALVLIKS